MARKPNTSLFLEYWLRTVSGGSSLSSNGLVNARSIIQAWSEIRESLQNKNFDTRYLQALRVLVSSESTIHVADSQAKLLVSVLALKDVSIGDEGYTLVVRLLYVWIRKSFRPSEVLVGSAVQAILGVFEDRRNLEPGLVAQSVLVAGAFASVPSLCGELKAICLELVCRVLEEECLLVVSREEFVAIVLAGVGYALSSSLDVHYFRLLDFLFGVWLKDVIKWDRCSMPGEVPLYVATKMASIRRASFFVPSPESYAKIALCFVGYEACCTPYWPHTLLGAIVSSLPVTVFESFYIKRCLQIRKKGMLKDSMKNK